MKRRLFYSICWILSNTKAASIIREPHSNEYKKILTLACLAISHYIFKLADELLEGKRTEKSIKSFWERQFRLYKYVAKIDNIKVTHTRGGDGDELEGKAEAGEFTEAICNEFRNSWKYELFNEAYVGSVE